MKVADVGRRLGDRPYILTIEETRGGCEHLLFHAFT